MTVVSHKNRKKLDLKPLKTLWNEVTGRKKRAGVTFERGHATSFFLRNEMLSATKKIAPSSDKHHRITSLCQFTSLWPLVALQLSDHHDNRCALAMAADRQKLHNLTWGGLHRHLDWWESHSHLRLPTPPCLCFISSDGYINTSVNRLFVRAVMQLCSHVAVTFSLFFFVFLLLPLGRNFSDCEDTGGNRTWASERQNERDFCKKKKKKRERGEKNPKTSIDSSV